MSEVQDLQAAWAAIEPVLRVENEAQYDEAIRRIDALIDEGAVDSAHPLHGLLNVLGTLVHEYEEVHYPMPEAKGIDVLRFLMEQHGLKQSDLPEIGSQGVVSEILSGKRELNVRQIARLSERFGVPADVFIDKKQEAA